jgi:hypothetical protein
MLFVPSDCPPLHDYLAVLLAGLRGRVELSCPLVLPKVASEVMSVTSAMAAKLLWVEMELLVLSCWIFHLDVRLFDGLDHLSAGALVLVMT